MRIVPEWLAVQATRDGRKWANDHAPMTCLGTGQAGFIEGAAWIYIKFKSAIDEEIKKQELIEKQKD